MSSFLLRHKVVLGGLTAITLILMAAVAYWALRDNQRSGIDKQLAAMRVFDSLLEARNGRILVSGTIVDDSGNPVDGVKAELEAIRMQINRGDFSKSAKSIVALNHEFELDIPDARHLYITFEKDGYHNVNKFYSFGQARTKSYRIDKHRNLHISGVKIVMDKPEKPADLVGRDVTLYLKTTGEARTYQVYKADHRIAVNELDNLQNSPKDPMRWIRSPIGFFVHEYIYRDLNTTDLPEHTIYLSAPYSSDSGKFILSQKCIYNREMLPDAKLRIVCGDDEGVIPVTDFSLAENDTWTRAFRHFKQAPLTGYVKEMAVPIGTPKNLYFYFKLNGFYGKGLLEGLRYSEKTDGAVGQEIRVSATLYIQPDGSNNLDQIGY